MQALGEHQQTVEAQLNAVDQRFAEVGTSIQTMGANQQRVDAKLDAILAHLAATGPQPTGPRKRQKDEKDSVIKDQRGAEGSEPPM
jgi:hypothetical protein